MGYACPVCADPQADGEHLANHLAFTAMLGDDAHETWLDEHAPGWGDCDPAELAERVIAHAPEEDYPQVFEDTTAPGAEQSDDPGDRPASRGTFLDEVPEEAANVVSRARELTRRRRTARTTSARGTPGDSGADGGPTDDASGHRDPPEDQRSTGQHGDVDPTRPTDGATRTEPDDADPDEATEDPDPGRD